ncbi:MAG: sigma 54-interacting transcriptional regulator [Proteobacteria bacterium]|nr:sigma 54-interacting transcriptional regulator [Pseudomonadota bacterium]
MSSIVLATEDERLLRAVAAPLTSAGFSVLTCVTAGDALALLAQRDTRLVLVDGRLNDLDAPLFAKVAKAVPHEPAVRSLHKKVRPLRAAELGDPLLRLARRHATPVLSAEERELVGLLGLGAEALTTLRQLGHNPLPLRIEGEPGTGKEQVARFVHRLSTPESPFVVLRAGEEPELSTEHPGTIYLEGLHRHTDIVALLQLSLARGWRVIGSSRRRHEPDREGMAWTHIRLRPLRERPKDLRPLTRLYLRRYRKRLGLPSRRIHKGLWVALEAHTWPVNLRELESFVVQAATSARGTALSPATLPRRVMERLTPEGRQTEEGRAFERVVEDRLRPVVLRFESGDGPTLHRMVVDATERALFRLVLARTGGNQKAAAELLGLARNTLRTRMDRLDPFEEQG